MSWVCFTMRKKREYFTKTKYFMKIPIIPIPKLIPKPLINSELKKDLTCVRKKIKLNGEQGKVVRVLQVDRRRKLYST